MALLTAAGATMVALLMVGSAAAASANTVVVPKYKGLVAPENEVYADGCSSAAKEITKSAFSLKTGLGKFADTGKAGNCGKKLPKGFSFYNSAGTDAGFEVLVKLPKLNAATTNVSANLGGKVSWSATATTGGKSGACPSSINSYTESDTTWEWNNFASYAYEDNFSENGVWSNTSYNTASIPSPFNLNNTTYYYHFAENFSESNLECFAEVFGETSSYGYLCDTTAGFCESPTSATTPEFAYSEVGIENFTDYSTTGYVENYWDRGSGSNYSSGAYNDNTSGSFWDVESCGYISCTFSSGTSPGNTSQTWTNSSVFTGTSQWWNNFGGSPFNASHQYYYELELTIYMDAENENWAHGDASFSLNGATAGNGVKLNSISIS